MSISMATKQWIADIAERIPPEKRAEFLGRIQDRLAQVNEAPILGPLVIGGLIGAIVEIVPGLESLTGIDDGVEAGAAIGAGIGLGRSKGCDPVRMAILEELNRVLAKS